MYDQLKCISVDIDEVCLLVAGDLNGRRSIMKYFIPDDNEDDTTGGDNSLPGDIFQIPCQSWSVQTNTYANYFIKCAVN